MEARLFSIKYQLKAAQVSTMIRLKKTTNFVLRLINRPGPAGGGWDISRPSLC
jgi:hypothetical protein